MSIAISTRDSQLSVLHSPDISGEVIAPLDYYQTLYMGTKNGVISVCCLQIQETWKYGTFRIKPARDVTCVVVLKTNPSKPYKVLMAFKNGAYGVWHSKVGFGLRLEKLIPI